MLMTSRHLHRRQSTPVRSVIGSGPGESLPSDVLCQTCSRVGIVGIVFASLWTLTIFMNTVVARWFGEMTFLKGLWPFPDHLVAGLGIVTFTSITVLARRLSGKPVLVDVGSGYLVLQCLLVSILSQWAPVPI